MEARRPLDLTTVDTTLRAHPARADSKAVLYAGRWVIAYVVVKPPGMLVLSTLRDSLRQRLPDDTLPACCLALQSLPRTAEGTVSNRWEDYPAPGADDFAHFQESLE